MVLTTLQQLSKDTVTDFSSTCSIFWIFPLVMKEHMLTGAFAEKLPWVRFNLHRFFIAHTEDKFDLSQRRFCLSVEVVFSRSTIYFPVRGQRKHTAGMLWEIPSWPILNGLKAEERSTLVHLLPLRVAQINNKRLNVYLRYQREIISKRPRDPGSQFD